MATLQDIAKLVGVSIATVSYALNNKGNIKDETRQKILEAAVQLDYRHDYQKPMSDLGHARTIGVLINGFSGAFHAQILSSLENAAIQNNFHMAVFSPTASEPGHHFFQSIIDLHALSGMIVLNYKMPDNVLLKSCRTDFPIVTLDRVLEGNNLWSVTADNYAGSYEGVQYLIKNGHREIGFMGAGVETRESLARYRAYFDALTQNGINPKAQIYCQGNHVEDGGYSAARTLILQERLPRAIFCSNDEMAYGVIKACNEANKKLLSTISIIGFDDIDRTRNESLGLTTVRQPLHQVSNVAMQLFIMALNRDLEPKHTTLKSKLIIRQSVQQV